MRSNKGDAYVLATAIYAGTKGSGLVDIDEVSDRLYRAMSGMGSLGTDEAKADIYAQLAETLTAETSFQEAVSIIEKVLDETEKYIG
jgi:pyridoxal/pyridoxine/pyridoxamine kinase